MSVAVRKAENGDGGKRAGSLKKNGVLGEEHLLQRNGETVARS
jgi:hypothetical protein